MPDANFYGIPGFVMPGMGQLMSILPAPASSFDGFSFPFPSLPSQLGHLTLEDYQIWSVKSALANEFLNLLFQVCLGEV